MKFVPHAAAISLIATQAAAGGLSDAIVETPEVMEPEVMTEPTGSAGWVIPALILGGLIIAASTGGDDDDDDEPVTVEEAIVVEEALIVEEGLVVEEGVTD